MTRISLIGIMMLSLISFSAFAVNDSNLPDVPIGEPGKKAGDIISPATRIEIASWCDFSKQIVNVNGTFVCVFRGGQ